ncbi:MAG: hypothetical protein ACREQY_07450, partial [Candidatus Binatia bacterium]
DLIALLAERVDEQPARAVRILEAVSISGEPLERSVLLSLPGTGEVSRLVIANLGRARLLRLLKKEGKVSIEVYHDRIRDAVLSRLDPPEIRDWHLELGEALEGHPTANPEALFRHFAGADRPEKAADYAVRAAENATASLAFLHAAELYGRALELRDWSRAERGRLTELRGEAFANAGHGGRAAAEFLAAGALEGGDLRLRRRAWEQFFRSGRVEEGVEALRATLREGHTAFPDSRAAAIVGLLSGVLRLCLRNGRYVPRSERDVPPQALNRLDDYISAARGLIMVDPLCAG